MFKDDEPAPGEGGEGDGKKANENEIVWDDEAVDALLDRTRDTDPKVNLHSAVIMSLCDAYG